MLIAQTMAAQIVARVMGGRTLDHALSRVEKGGAGHLIVEGPENPKIFKEGIDHKLSLN